jgi:hypothetical protein
MLTLGGLGFLILCFSEKKKTVPPGCKIPTELPPVHRTEKEENYFKPSRCKVDDARFEVPINFNLGEYILLNPGQPMNQSVHLTLGFTCLSLL